MTDVARLDARALKSVAVMFFINGAVYASFLPRLPELRTRIGVSLATIGLILTLAAVGGLIGSWLTGTVISRLGSKRAMILGAAGVIVALPLVGVSTSAAALFGALATIQFFDVWTDASMNLQGSWISARRRIPVMNRLHGLWSLGAVAGGAVAASLAGAGLSIELHMVAVSIALMLAILYAAPGLLADQPTVDLGENRGEPRKDANSRRRLPAMLFVLGVAGLVIEMVPTEWAPFRLTEDLETGLGLAGLGFVAVTAGMMVGRFGGDVVQARLGRGRMTTVALAVAAAGLALGTLFSSLALTLGGFFITGLGAAVLLPVLYDDAARAPGRAGAGLGALTAGIRVGAIAAPVLVGVLADRQAISVGVAMLIVAGIAIVVMFLAASREVTES